MVSRVPYRLNPVGGSSFPARLCTVRRPGTVYTPNIRGACQPGCGQTVGQYAETNCSENKTKAFGYLHGKIILSADNYMALSDYDQKCFACLPCPLVYKLCWGYYIYRLNFV